MTIMMTNAGAKGYVQPAGNVYIVPVEGDFVQIYHQLSPVHPALMGASQLFWSLRIMDEESACETSARRIRDAPQIQVATIRCQMMRQPPP